MIIFSVNPVKRSLENPRQKVKLKFSIKVKRRKVQFHTYLDDPLF